MSPFLWIALAGTVFGLAFLVNGLRLSAGPEGHAANAGRLHVAMAGMFVPLLWVVVLFSLL